MTEELKQKAEESAKQNCPMPVNWNEIDVAEKAGYIKGYIAGATENGIQWHKVANGDLPKPFGKYEKEHYPQIPCLVEFVHFDYGVRYWNVYEQCWDDEECDDYYCETEQVKRWCYLDDLIGEDK